MSTAPIQSRSLKLSNHVADLGRGSSSALLSRQVRVLLLDLLHQQWSPHLRLPPIKQIADDLGIGVGTANRAVKGLVDAGLLVSRQRLGTTIAPGCSAEDIDRVLTHERQRLFEQRESDRGKVVRVLMKPHADDMIVEMAEAFARSMAESGIRTQFDEYPELRRHWVNDEADGHALFQPSSADNYQVSWSYASPLLVVATEELNVDGPGRYDLLSVDDEQGAYLAGRRLRQAGCKSVCFVGGHNRNARDQFNRVALRRLRGFERGWGEPVPEANRIVTGSYDIKYGATAVAKYVAMSPRPEAVFTASDDLACGFQIGSFSHELFAGKDYQLIGFDKQQRAVDAPEGPITSIEVPRRELGLRAAELMASRLADVDQPPRKVQLGCRLFEGTTVRPVQSNDMSLGEST